MFDFGLQHVKLNIHHTYAWTCPPDKPWLWMVPHSLSWNLNAERILVRTEVWWTLTVAGEEFRHNEVKYASDSDLTIDVSLWQELGKKGFISMSSTSNLGTT